MFMDNGNVDNRGCVYETENSIAQHAESLLSIKNYEKLYSETQPDNEDESKNFDKCDSLKTVPRL